MREENALQAMSPMGGLALGDVQSMGAATYVNRSLRSVASASERVGHLIRRAMTFLGTDRRAAWLCLRDASTLLGAEPQESSNSAPALPNGFRPGGLARWQAMRAVAHIEVNLGSKIEIRELADLLALSKSHFSRAFKRSLGLSPMAYVAVRRVERAKVMMTSSAEQLTEIALACGFADQSHLNRSFRRRVGVSPGLWRRTQAKSISPIAAHSA
jgi:AraC family transcriptional regulator